MELGAEISEITLRRLVWRCLVCTDRFFFLPCLRLVAVFAVPEKKKIKKNALSNIKDVILLPRRARDKSPPLWALLLLSPLTFIASQIIFPQTCHPSCLSGILPCPHLIKMFSPLFSSLLMVCALRKLCIFTANLSVFRQIFIYSHVFSEDSSFLLRFSQYLPNQIAFTLGKDQKIIYDSVLLVNMMSKVLELYLFAVFLRVGWEKWVCLISLVQLDQRENWIIIKPSLAR